MPRSGSRVRAPSPAPEFLADRADSLMKARPPKRAFLFPGRRFDLWLRVEMLWLPAKIEVRLRAAQALIEPVAPGPFAEFSRDRVAGDDRKVLRSATSPCEGALRPTGQPSIAAPMQLDPAGAAKGQSMQRDQNQIVAAPQRPATSSLCDDVDHVARGRLTRANRCSVFARPATQPFASSEYCVAARLPLSQAHHARKFRLKLVFDCSAPRCIRFSASSDVLPFCRLTYLTDRHNHLSGRSKSITGQAATACIGE